MPQNSFLKSPLNYTGGKHKLLPQLLPLFPNNINLFVDLFAGGCNVAINVTQAQRLLCCDTNSRIMALYRALQVRDGQRVLSQIDRSIEMFRLSKDNEDGFLAFRDVYNAAPDPIDLYTLAAFSFNYQIRFNNRLQYNSSFGRDRSCFSTQMRGNLIAFMRRIKSQQIRFETASFDAFDPCRVDPGSLVYCDPPYLITTGNYNDGKRGFGGWDEAQERKLLALLDDLNRKGVRFALSNVVEHKGQANRLLQQWSAQYRVTGIDSDYSNASYHGKDRHAPSREVLVVNFRQAV